MSPLARPEAASERRWELSVEGVHPEELAEACGGHLLIGADDGGPVAVDWIDLGGAQVLTATGSAGDRLSQLEGEVRLWWPDGRGRAEVEGTVARGLRRSTVSVGWPPRQTQDRRHLRAPVTGRVHLLRLFPDGEATGQLLDLGAGGAGLVLDVTPPWWEVGVRIGIGMELPGGDVTAAATVVRGSVGTFSAGVRFDSISSADEDRVISAVLSADSRRAGR